MVLTKSTLTDVNSNAFNDFNVNFCYLSKLWYLQVLLFIISIRISLPGWDRCHASNPRKSLQRIGVCHLSWSSKKRNSCFLLSATSLDVLPMQCTWIGVLPGLQAKLQSDSANKKPSGRKNDWATHLKLIIIFLKSIYSQKCAMLIE